MKKLLILMLVLSIVLAGCSSEPNVSENKTDDYMKQPIPSNYSTYTDDINLYSISYPAEWELDFSLINDLQQKMKELIRDINSDLPIEKWSIIFIAGIPTGTGYSPNINIGLEPVPVEGVTYDEVIMQEIIGIKTTVQGYRQNVRIDTNINGRKATILEWEGIVPNLGKLHVLQMFVLVGKNVWIITGTPKYEEFKEYEDEFYYIFRSLEINI